MNNETTGKPLTVRELIGQLMHQDPDAEVVLFADGDVYPALVVQKLDEYAEVEIGGGWVPYQDTGDGL